MPLPFRNTSPLRAQKVYATTVKRLFVRSFYFPSTRSPRTIFPVGTTRLPRKRRTMGLLDYNTRALYTTNAVVMCGEVNVRNTCNVSFFLFLFHNANRSFCRETRSLSTPVVSRTRFFRPCVVYDQTAAPRTYSPATNRRRRFGTCPPGRSPVFSYNSGFSSYIINV